MIEIIPAILPKDFAELSERLGELNGLTRSVQIDIMDGSFTEDSTWPYRKDDDNFKAILSEESGMPYWENIDFEFDLMVKEPARLINHWITAGANRVIFHIDSDTPEELIKLVNEWQDHVEIGLAVKIDTEIERIKSLVDNFDFVQVMGIDNIGFQGQGFDEKAVAKVKEIRSITDKDISVDGGVSDTNAKDLALAGATRLVVGSFVWKSDSPNQALVDLEAVLGDLMN